MKNTIKLGLTFAIITSFAFVKPVANDPENIITVVIDAGHGGEDHGMKLEGFSEKEIVAAISQKIKENNHDKNVIIHLTRTNDKFISLQGRVDFINNLKPDLILSLHVNGNKNTALSGVEFFVSPSNEKYETSKNSAEKINSHIVSSLQMQSNGVKDANFMILKNTKYPAIIMELGYLSNKNDRNWLTDSNQQEKIALVILEAISELK
jgi:N-acetylmuramoyl-L-alanine amidase